MSRRKQYEEEKPILAVCGDTGLKENYGRIYEEFHRKLRGGQQYRIFKEMLYNEGNVFSSYLAIQLLLRNTPRTVKMNESGHPQAAECQEYVEQCLNDMESTMQEIISEISTAIPFGFSYLETTFKIRKGASVEPRLNSQYSDGRYGWRDWSIRSAESLEEWSFSDEGRLLGMYQRTDRHPEKLQFIPLDRALHFRFLGSKDNPEGFSAFRPAYVAYYYLTRFREIEAIAAERNGAGLPVARLPLNIMNADANTNEAAIRTLFENLVRRVRMGEESGVVIPSRTMPNGQDSGFDFELLSASGRNILEIDPIIQRNQNEILKVFLTQFLAFGTQQVGSYSLSADMTNLLGYALGAYNSVIDEEITKQAFPTLLRLEDYPVEAWPTLESGDIERSSLTETGQFLSALISSGAITARPELDEWAYRQAGVEISEDPAPGAPLDDESEMADSENDPMISESVEAADDGESAEEAPEVMTMEELESYLRLPRKQISRAIRRGQLPGNKVGRAYVIRREDLDAFMRGNHGQQ